MSKTKPEIPKQPQHMPIQDAMQQISASLNCYSASARVVVSADGTIEIQRLGQAELGSIRQALGSIQNAINSAAEPGKKEPEEITGKVVKDDKKPAATSKRKPRKRKK